MIIEQGSPAETVMVFVFKDTMEESTEEPAPNVLIRRAGRSFEPATNAPVQIRNADGSNSAWWLLELTPAETNTAGPLIVVAEKEGCHTWRDLHQIVATAGQQPTHGSTEALVAIARRQLDQARAELAVLRTIEAQLTAETTIAEETPGPDPDPDNLLQNGRFTAGLDAWRLYCPDGISGSPSPDGLTLDRIDDQRNCQLYQVISLEPGPHIASIRVTAARPTKIALHAIGHDQPYESLGLNEPIWLEEGTNDVVTEWTLPADVATPAKRARFRVWLGEMMPGESVTIHEVALHRGEEEEE